jgi:hypothetical protein
MDPENDNDTGRPLGAKATTMVTEHDDGVPKGSDGPPSQQHQQHRGHPQRLLTGRTVFVTGLAPGLATIHLEMLLQKFGTVE